MVRGAGPFVAERQYPEAHVHVTMGALDQLRACGETDRAETEKRRYVCRMHELSEFCKTVKQRFSQSYNRRHSRKGTLWEERFKSLIVQGEGHALATVAAYVDLNAVRAGIVKDPAEYRFCGYGEAMGGSRKARAGITKLMVSLGYEGDWPQVAAAYRRYLFEAGQEKGLAEDGTPLKAGLSAEAVDRVRAEEGELSRAQLLRCRVRYFTDGVVLGSRIFVDDVFGRYRNRFSQKRTTGARPMRGSAWGDLCTARRLRLDVITPPA